MCEGPCTAPWMPGEACDECGKFCPTDEERNRWQEHKNAEAYARFEAAENRWDVLASGWCPKCNSAQDTVDEQYSFGVYAGIMCTACAIRGFRDGCGHLDGRQGNAADLDEPMDED